MHWHDHSEHHHHGHSHHAHDDAAHSDSRVVSSLVRALLITVAFMAVEFVGGFMANSLALLSDAAHMLTDVGAMLLSLFAFWVSRRPSSSRMTFGYHRAEILGALTSGLLVWLIAGLLIYEAIQRLGSPPEVKGPLLSVIAVIGLAANLFSLKVLSKSSKENMNVRAAYVHVIADSLGSVGALIAGLVIWWTDWRMIDLIVSIVFAVLMLFSSWKLVKESVQILMESAPAGMDAEEVRQALAGVPGVREVHDLHIWTVASGRPALSVHLVSPEADRVLEEANQVLESRFGIRHTTVQIEHPDKFQSSRCYDCAAQG